MLRRECEVRICQARHLVPKSFSRKGGEKSPITGVVVLCSHDGVHVSTEVCRSVENPTWQRVASFQLVLTDSPEESGEVSTEAVARTRIPKEVQPVSNSGEVMQSRNPFAKNFVPPEAMQATVPPPTPSQPPSTPLLSSTTTSDPPLRTSLVLHFHVLSENFMSRELLGDVAVDIVPLLTSGGGVLATDRLGHVDQAPPAGVPTDASVAVDTWIALRQKNGELRVQILVKSISPVSLSRDVNGGGGKAGHLDLSGGHRPSSKDEARHLLGASGSRSNAVKPDIPRNPFDTTPTVGDSNCSDSDDIARGNDQGASQEIGVGRGAPLDADELLDRRAEGREAVRRRTSAGYLQHARIGSWYEFDAMALIGRVKAGICLGHGSLDDQLLQVQEQYDFSAARGYREGRPDGDVGDEGGQTSTESTAKAPEWPTCFCDAAQLKRDMQFGAWRNSRQSVGENTGLSCPVSRGSQYRTLFALFLTPVFHRSCPADRAHIQRGQRN